MRLRRPLGKMRAALGLIAAGQRLSHGAFYGAERVVRCSVKAHRPAQQPCQNRQPMPSPRGWLR